ACVPASTTSACHGPAASDGTGAAARASSITTTAVPRRRRDGGSIALFPQIRSPACRLASATGLFQGGPVAAHAPSDYAPFGAGSSLWEPAVPWLLPSVPLNQTPANCPSRPNPRRPPSSPLC